jgi:hypothetical protein
MRSEREPLVRLGVLSNRVMVVWGSVTVVFVLFATVVLPGPGLQPLLGDRHGFLLALDHLILT